MLNYKEINIDKISSSFVDKLYEDLLENKWQFIIINIKDRKYVLTKEKSFFEIENDEKFLKDAKEDIFYKTVIEEKCEVQDMDLKRYQSYIERYKTKLEKIKYGNKYLFGSVAVRLDRGGFITTVRGKNNLEDYTIVKSVNHNENIVRVCNKKATLNAPLLDYLFRNERVKVIVHINHEFDNSLPYYDYAFPGTKRDCIRDNSKSFNIKHHGVIYLFDKDEKLI